MLKSTFCHLYKISLTEEKKLWDKGIYNWDDLINYGSVYWKDFYYNKIAKEIKETKYAYKNKNINYFLKALPKSELYRIYPDFKNMFCFIDIETNGLHEKSYITCLSILNKDRIKSFTKSINLNEADKALKESKIVVTFYGTNFDIPKIKKEFPNFNPKYHIDLAKLLVLKGIKGKLKNIASKLKWVNKENSSKITNGKEATIFWDKFLESNNYDYLNHLILYNQQDTLILKYIINYLLKSNPKLTIS